LSDERSTDRFYLPLTLSANPPLAIVASILDAITATDVLAIFATTEVFRFTGAKTGTVQQQFFQIVDPLLQLIDLFLQIQIHIQTFRKKSHK